MSSSISSNVIMDYESIMDAATRGDAKFLWEAFRDNRGDRRSRFMGDKEADEGRNLLHWIVENNRCAFLNEALIILSSDPSLVIDLICQRETRSGCNPLHIAARTGNIFNVKLLAMAYSIADAAPRNYEQETEAPWLQKNSRGETPIRCCFNIPRDSQETIACYLLSFEDKWLSRIKTTAGRDSHSGHLRSTMILDRDQTSILFNAMQTGYSRLVEQILSTWNQQDTDVPYSVDGNKLGQTPLHYAFKCSEKSSSLLLSRHQELIGTVSVEGGTVLDSAVQEGATWLVKLMLEGGNYENKACRRLIWHQNGKGDTPLHIAARKGDIDIAKLVIQAYASAVVDESREYNEIPLNDQNGYAFLGFNPMYIENNENEVPLNVALTSKHDDLGVMLSRELFPLSVDQMVRGLHWKALIAAVNNGCIQSGKTILATIVAPGSDKLLATFEGDVILAPDVLQIFSYLFEKYQERSKTEKSEEIERLSEVVLKLLKQEENKGETLLKEAAKRGEDWLVRLLLESDGYLITDSAPAWQVACENGRLLTLCIFIDKFGHQEFIEHCRDSKQTPLHHIKLDNYGQYVDLLKMPVIDVLTNEIDSNGATPLHLAIQRGDLGLTKALLETNGVDVSIKDKDGSTAFALLENHCQSSKSWHEEYMKVLRSPVMERVKNQIDRDGTTTLHRAIQCDDLVLTKALLEIKGIEVGIKDKNGTTTFDLLENRCTLSKSWAKMCREIEQKSTVGKLKYILRKISFEGMQNTVCIVAALVATITFAAGITVPGGLTRENIDGSPLLAKKSAFLVFSVSNTVAMCSSVMVLFLLLGPMMWNPQPSLFYVDLSLFLLLVSLGGTILAFMTGVYATMIHQVEWSSIFVIALCTLTLAVAWIFLLSTYSSRFKKLVFRPFNTLGNVTTKANKALLIDAGSSTPPINPKTSQQPAGSCSIQQTVDDAKSDSPITSAPELRQQQQRGVKWEMGQSSGISTNATNQVNGEHIVNLS